MATRASRLRLIRRAGTACSRSMVVTVCWCSSSWRRVFTSRGPPACSSGVWSVGPGGAGAWARWAGAVGSGGRGAGGAAFGRSGEATPWEGRTLVRVQAAGGPGGLLSPTAARGCQGTGMPAPLITSPMAPSTCSPAQLSISCRPRERSCTRGARSRRNKSWRLPGCKRSNHTPRSPRGWAGLRAQVASWSISRGRVRPSSCTTRSWAAWAGGASGTTPSSKLARIRPKRGARGGANRERAEGKGAARGLVEPVSPSAAGCGDRAHGGQYWRRGGSLSHPHGVP